MKAVDKVVQGQGHETAIVSRNRDHGEHLGPTDAFEGRCHGPHLHRGPIGELSDDHLHVITGLKRKFFFTKSVETKYVSLAYTLQNKQFFSVFRLVL